MIIFMKPQCEQSMARMLNYLDASSCDAQMTFQHKESRDPILA